MVAGQNEHDPPRSRDRRNLERQHSRGTALQGAGRDLENVRLHRCQSTVSAKAWSTGFDPTNAEFHRFDCGVPPAKNGDYAFLLHAINSLNSGGKAAVILPHGALFRGRREADIFDSEHLRRPIYVPTLAISLQVPSGPIVPGHAARYIPFS